MTVLWPHLQRVTVLSAKTRVHALVVGLHMEHGHGRALRCESVLVYKQSNANFRELVHVFY